MSDHKKPMTPELRQALIDHRLPVDTPSQLADSFRHGWNAKETNLSNAKSSELEEQIKALAKDWVEEKAEYVGMIQRGHSPISALAKDKEAKVNEANRKFREAIKQVCEKADRYEGLCE